MSLHVKVLTNNRVSKLVLTDLFTHLHNMYGIVIPNVLTVGSSTTFF